MIKYLWKMCYFCDLRFFQFSFIHNNKWIWMNYEEAHHAYYCLLIFFFARIHLFVLGMTLFTIKEDIVICSCKENQKQSKRMMNHHFDWNYNLFHKSFAVWKHYLQCNIAFHCCRVASDSQVMMRLEVLQHYSLTMNWTFEK